VERWLGELALALKHETYRPNPIRRVFISKMMPRRLAGRPLPAQRQQCSLSLGRCCSRRGFRLRVHSPGLIRRLVYRQIHATSCCCCPGWFAARLRQCE
jgi:hypothetical protein